MNRHTLSNGLDVLIQEDRAQKVAAIQLWVIVGSADEEPSERGISHLIEHMAFKGTPTRGVGEIAGSIETLGGEINAYTSWDETVFHVTVPARAVMEGLDILTDAVLNPTLDPEELAKEKEVVLEEILEAEERPERKISKLLFRTAYEKSPYRFPVIGYKETVAGFTRDDVIAFREKWYVPENMFLLIVGNVDSDKLMPEIERLLGALPPKAFFRSPRPKEPPQTEIRSAVIRDGSAREARCHIAFHIPSIRGNDVNALDLAADVLGSRESSRLIRVLKNEKQLVNSIHSYSLTPKKPGIFVVSLTLEGKNLEAAVKEVMEQLEALAKTPPTAEELERAKIHIESQHLYARESVDGTARSIGSFEADIGDAAYEEKYLQLNRATTAEEVSAAVREYLRPPNTSVVVLMPDEQEPDFKIESLTDPIATYNSRRKGQEKAFEEGEKQYYTLKNGIRVVLEPDPSNAVVSFRIASLGGKRFETRETEGIMNFIARMIAKGAGDMDEGTINRKIEDMGGRLRGFSGYDSVGVSATFFSRHLKDGLKLLGTLYSDPTWPEEQLERERTLILNSIKTLPDKPVPFAITKLNEVVYPDHPYGFNKDGSLETVMSFTREDLMRTYRRYVVPSNTVITAVGDMNVPETLKAIEEIFGSVPEKKFEEPDIPEETPITDVIRKTVEIPRAKAHVTIGFRGTTLQDDDRYALAVLNNVLAGQGGRLFLQLRDKESLAYIVTSFFRPGLDPGIFAFYIATEPSKAEQAVESLLREINRVRSAPVEDRELARSIKNLIGNHEIHLQSTWDRAENTGLNTLYGLGYDYDEEYIRRLGEVTADDVLKVAEKYLNPEKCVVLKIMPEENESGSDG